MSNNERLAKAETYLSPNLVFLAWMTPESDIKVTLTRTEQINCRGQVVQRKGQIILSGDELTILRNFFPVIDQFIYFQRHKFSQNVGQMDLQSSDLPEEVQKLVKGNSVKKVVFHAKTEYVPANYVVEMLHDNDNDITNDSRSYTRYEIFYCSEV